MNKTARIKVEKPGYSANTLATINLSAREAQSVKEHIELWTTFIMNMTTQSGVEIFGKVNSVYTNDEIISGLTKVLEGLGYEVRS